MKGVVFLIALLFALGAVQGQNSTCQTCPAKGCGNGICEAGLEDCQSCPFDCGLCPTCDNICGNHLCEAAALESPCNCPQDCGICCVDGLCRGLENPANCPQDCTGILTGTVYDVETLELLDNATVVCQSRSISVVGSSSNGGAFAFAGLPADYYTCTATKAEYMTGSNSIFFQPGSAVLVNSTVRVPLRQPPGMIVGFVKDGYGNFFIRGANVTCTYLARDMNKFTSNLGSYFFHDLKPGTYSCWAGAPGYYPAPRVTAEVFRGVVTTVNFTLNPVPPNLFGKVIDRTTGLTLAGATVKCWLARDGTALPTLLSDPVGAFAHYNLLASIYNCESFLVGYTRGKGFACLEWGKNGTVVLIMQKLPSALRGNVTEKDTGVPIFGAKVTCVATTSYRQNTPRDGKYDFRTVQSGDYTCTCSAPDYDGDVKSVFVPPGQTAIANCVLTPKPATLTGRVFDVETNSSLSGYTVSCFHVDKKLTFSTTSNVTNGRYLFTPVPAGLMACQCIGDATYMGSNGSVVLVRGGFHVLDCPMTPYKGSLRVKVYDSEDKTPLAGATVYCSSSLGRTVTFTTDNFGTNFLLNLRIQTWNCYAAADGYASSANKSGIIVSNQELLLEFPLDPLPGGIIGHVFNAKGMVGIPGVTVSCSFVSSGKLIGTTTTDATGFYYILKVKAGGVTCTASLPDYSSDTKTGTVFRGRNTTIDFIIAGLPGRLIVFVGVDPTRDPLPGSSVSCKNVDDATIVYSGLTIADATITFTSVPAGTYSCDASSDGYFPNSKSGIIVVFNKDTRAEILLKAQPGLLVITTIDDSTNLLLPNCTVVVSPGALTSRTNATAVTTYTVAAGVYAAVGSHPGYLDGSKSAINVARNGITYVELRLVPLPGALVVSVVASDTNLPLPGSSVTCRGGSFNNVTTAPAPLATINYVMTEYIAYTCTGTYPNYSDDTKTSDVVTRNGITYVKLVLTPKPNQLVVIVKELVSEKLITTAFVTVTTYTETPVDAAASVTYNPIAPGSYVASARATGYANNSTAVPGLTSTTHGASIVVVIYLKPIPCQLTVKTVLASDNSLLAGVAVSVTGFSTFVTGPNGTFTYTFDSLPASGTVSASLTNYTSSGDQTFTCGLNGTINIVITFVPIPNRLIVIVKELITEKLITSAFVTVTVSAFAETAVDGDASATFFPLPSGVYTAAARASGYLSNSTGVPGIDRNTRAAVITVVIYLQPIPCTLIVRTLLNSDKSPLAGVAVSVTGFTGTLPSPASGSLSYTIGVAASASSGVATGELSGFSTNGPQSWSCGLNQTVTVTILLDPIPNQIIVTVLDARTFELITTAFVTLTPGFSEVSVDATASTTFSPVAAGTYTAFGRAAGYSSNSTGPTTVLRNQTVRIFVYLTQLPCNLRVITLTTQNTSLVIAGANLAINNGQANRTSSAAGIVDYVLPYNNATRISGSKASYGSNFTDFTCGKGDNVTVIVYLPEILTIVFAAVDAKSPNNPYINANITFNGELVPADPNDSRFHYKAVDSLPLTGIVVATSAGFNDQTDTGIRFTLTKRNYTISLAPQEFTLYFTPVELIKSSTDTRGFFESRLDGSGYLPNNYFDLNPTELRSDVAYIPKPIQIGGSTIRNTSPQTSNAYTANVTIPFVDFTSVTVLASKFDNVSPPPLDSFTILPSPISGMVANWAAANITGNEVVINVPPFASTAERNLLTNYPYQLASGYIMLRVVAFLPDARTATAFGDNDFVAATITLGRTSQFTNYNSKNIPLGGKVKCFFEFPLAFQSGVTDIQVTAPLQTYNLTLSNFLNPDTGALTTAKSGPAYEAYTKFTFTLGTSIFSQTSTGQQARDPKASLSITRDYALVLLPAKKRSD